MIRLENISKIYKGSTFEVKAVTDLNLHINKGEFVSIMGSSGSGKTTLLNIIGLMDQPTSGEYYLNGQKTKELNKNQIQNLRNQYISFIFQQFALMNQYSVLENVEVPLVARGIKKRERREMCMEALSMLSIEELGEKKPTQISGGQQQRVAIARALVSENPIILADEPTGALDAKTGQELMDVFQQIYNQGRTVVIVTHDKEIAKRTKRIISL